MACDRALIDYELRFGEPILPLEIRHERVSRLAPSRGNGGLSRRQC